MAVAGALFGFKKLATTLKRREAMFNVGTTHHILAYVAAAVAAVSVILAGISRLIGQELALSIGGYMTLATVAIIFAIYFLIEGAAYYAKKGKK